jgi:zinc transport system ATP-binding protein
MTFLLEGRHIKARLGESLILDNVTIGVAPRQIVTLIGPNGSGKTTLLKALLGLIQVDGDIIRKANLKIGYVPQHFTRDRSLPLTVENFMTLYAGEQESLAALKRTDAYDIRKRQVATLSGGEMARVLLARAIATRPELLILDEPLAGVDVTGEAALYRLIAELRDEIGCGILLVSHDLHVVMAQADRVVCLNGHVCCEGSAAAVVSSPAFVEMFGPRVAGELALYTHHHDHTHHHPGHVHDHHHGEHDHG